MPDEDNEPRIFKCDFLESKRQRNQAEEDALKLRNRIKMLELEEKRAHKKLTKTKTKAEEIIKLKHRNYEKQKKRNEVKCNI